MEFKAFLSHRYKSPAVNQYFFDVFSRDSEVQFEVDAGKLSTCVTQIERLVRDCHAFIGIYPLPEPENGKLDKDWMLEESKYFRLECNIAIRSRVPMLVLYDRRYRDIFTLPDHVRSEHVDMREITSAGGVPNRRRHERVFDAFKDEVETYLEFHATSNQRHSKTSVGVLVPRGKASSHAYSAKELQILEHCLDDRGYPHVDVLEWPPVFDGTLLSRLDNMDFIVADVGNEAMATGIVGFLQGRFIPSVRLLKDTNRRGSVFARRPTQRNIFGALPIGYVKDIVHWASATELKSGFERRLDLMEAETRRINTRSEAAAYFDAAALRKDPVFLSYSGQNAPLARGISTELKKRFQSVFDYQDGESITPGEPWIKEIFDKLSGSKFAVPLISKSYLESENCMHEAREIVALRDAKKLRMIPLKLTKDEIERPSWMRDRQYMHLYDYADVVTAVDKLIEFFDRGV